MMYIMKFIFIEYNYPYLYLYIIIIIRNVIQVRTYCGKIIHVTNSSLFHIITIYIFLVGNKIVERILKRNFHNFLLVQTSTNTTSIPFYKIRVRVSFSLHY